VTKVATINQPQKSNSDKSSNNPLSVTKTTTATDGKNVATITEQ